MDWFWHALPVGGTLVALYFTVRTQNKAATKMEGAAGQRLDRAESDIGEIKLEQDKQWSKIGEHGERISRLEGPRRG